MYNEVGCNDRRYDIVTLRPSNKINQSDLKKIEIYERELQKYPLLQNYLGDVITKLVFQLANPLSIGLIREMFDGEISEAALNSVISLIGEDNFKNICEELLSKNCSSQPAFEREYFSLWGEVIAFRELLPDFPALRKITTIGDWQSGDCIFSVKTVLPLDFNCSIIENLLRSLFYIEEFTALGRCGDITIVDLQGVDDEFIISAVDILQRHIETILRTLTAKGQENWHTLDCPIPGGTRSIKIEAYMYNLAKEASIYIKEERSGRRNIQLDFKESEDMGLSIRYDTDSYWTGTEIDWVTLDRKIDEKLVKFDKAAKQVSDPQKFVGCIPILTHPSHMDYVRSERKVIKDHVRGMIDCRGYPIFVFFMPQIPFQGDEAVRIESSSFSSCPCRVKAQKQHKGNE